MYKYEKELRELVENQVEHLVNSLDADGIQHLFRETRTGVFPSYTLIEEFFWKHGDPITLEELKEYKALFANILQYVGTDALLTLESQKVGTPNV